ncbi:PhzF family phenazine biosynthesis protein [Oricola thermophila]|uniref:PhzF family phenazine biosynthesis protein n=1 Tax=Oricola thermophila TaxID=2742145 RepID=A0A6N1VDG1_9HYPH|nr:PhzF family phenazine biosynthesis protein [Oricola thermophila]QKV17282.1 PhzF family phenazine biosynthesis protein [Oricola thermophila]
MARRYAVYDVFTDRPLSGNPLAVVLDAEGLDDEAMQAIAREFNLSETVFVRPPENPAHRASLRIFTPGRELPFAGHPTVGAAIALGGDDSGGGESRLMVLEERIGPVRCALRMADSPYAEFDVPVLPEQVAVDIERAGVAAAIGLDESEIGFENHTISVWTAGNSFVFVPVHGLDAAARVSVNAMLWSDISPLVNGHRASLFLYCRDTVGHDCSFHGRMFAPEMGVSEDPATGSAVANFSGVIARFDGLDDGPTAFMIEQGIEMGRPSRIRLEIDARGGEMQAARIGGHAVKVAEGMLDA